MESLWYRSTRKSPVQWALPKARPGKAPPNSERGSAMLDEEASLAVMVTS